MILQVESHDGRYGDPEPHAFVLGDARIEVLDIADRWVSDRNSYFKVHASDAGIYILRYTPALREWDLAMYQAPRDSDSH